MGLKSKCRICHKECEDFFLHHGKMVCDDCYIRLINKRLKPTLNIQLLNNILTCLAILLTIIFTFLCGVAIVAIGIL